MKLQIVLFSMVAIMILGCRKERDSIINNEPMMEFPEIPVKYLQVPSSAYPTVQSAINSSIDGDTVIVLPGIYKEVLDMKGKNITLSSLYLLEKNEDYIEQTILDGKREWSVINFNNGETENCVLNGFTLRNGIGSKYNAYSTVQLRQGGGIYCWKSKPVLRNLIITENSSHMGSAIYCSQADVTLENIFITRNNNGSSVYISQCAPILNGISVINNDGSGILVKGATKINLSGLIIMGNSEDGCYLENSSIGAFKNNLIADNKRYAIIASAIYNGLKIENCTVAHNGNGLFNGENGVYVKNSIFWNQSTEFTLSVIMSGYSSVKVRYSDVKGYLTSYNSGGRRFEIDSTSIALDPKFCDPENGDYHLKPGSPCLTAGENGGLIGALGEGCSGE
ncbi:MAG TPA: hypothetical protein ENK44_14455 [Caldithrix abyssi]|uniref:Right handed beta helix domain-containing protein n=1 Tax=Caldithrix abyssi TaxID=187145 RepID=A0A7V4U2K8_CALAY|nr:hypothetical protein [Caldithrix abyssi]